MLPGVARRHAGPRRLGGRTRPVRRGRRGGPRSAWSPRPFVPRWIWAASCGVITRWHPWMRLMRSRRLRAGDLRANWPVPGRRRGVIQLRELIDLADPRAESPGESWLRSGDRRCRSADAGRRSSGSRRTGSSSIGSTSRIRGCGFVSSSTAWSSTQHRERRDRHDERRRAWLRAEAGRHRRTRGQIFTREGVDAWLDRTARALLRRQRTTFRSVGAVRRCRRRRSKRST